MNERRSVGRRRIDEAGLIAVDEHTSIPCLVYDVSVGGARLTLPNADIVPATFVLEAPCLDRAQVCDVMWRNEECIGAQFQVGGA